MFTGLIQSIGEIATLDQRGADARLRVSAPGFDMGDVKNGDSIAVDGVCLTVVERLSDGFAADVSAETVACTTFAGLRAGDRVNLEKALALGDRLGGHLVSGHVDGVGVVSARETIAQSVRFRIAAPAVLMKYIAPKGSVCLNGVSLTVNAVAGDTFDVNVIVHTSQVTTFGELKVGGKVNLEVDLLARYLERLIARGEADAPAHITKEWLAAHGFVK